MFLPRFMRPRRGVERQSGRFVPRLCALEDRTLPSTLVEPGFTEHIVVQGLDTPTAMEFAPDGRLFIAQKGGQVRVISNGQLLPNPFLSVVVNTISERGLDGITFDPSFASNGFVYVYYSTNATNPVNRLSRFTADPVNPNTALVGSERVLLDNIPSTNGNHNGGALHFGRDGLLYIGVGEVGVASNAQSLSSLSGKILRINPANPGNLIPPDNPFVGTPGARGEIWALGMRNPFTFAVQPQTARIFVNDVGGARFEEIDDLVKGGNYGWPTTEGVANQPPFIDPIHTYPHGSGTAITGGAFYEASEFPSSFRDSYFFGDYVAGFIRRLTPGTLQSVDFATNVPGPVDLDVGPDGSLFYLSIANGTVVQIQADQPQGGDVLVVGAAQGPPLVRVLDAASRVERSSFFAFDAAFTGGVRLASGDINRDGIPDIITAAGAGGGPNVIIYDGVTNKPIRNFFAYSPSFTGGVFIAASDINADGTPDIITGAGPGGGPHVMVFDGTTGEVLRSFFAYSVNFAGGVSVGTGDMNGDGHADIVTGAGSGGGPHVQVFDGVTGTVIESFFAYAPGFTGGIFVATGDVNGDGNPDIVTGPGAGGGPHVKAFDRSGTELLSFFAYEPSFVGGVRVATAAILSGGRAAIVTAPGGGRPTEVGIFDGLSQIQVDGFFAFDSTFVGGAFVG